VQEVKGGKIEFRVDKGGNLQAPIGRASFDAHKLEENLRALMNEIMRLRPAAAKGTYLRSVTISSTMGPGVRMDPAELTKV
jgi:large subunit ribosomal protein L1